MLKVLPILTVSYILCAPLAQANDVSSTESGVFTRQRASQCIQFNKELNLASQQMIQTETEKSNVKSKILYLQGAIRERRNLIEELDQSNYQQNNDNYNKLVSQYEDLVEEKKQTVEQFNDQQELHISQHNSVVRLEQRFSTQCLQHVQISQELYNDVCKLEEVRWCSAFKFN